jgi:heme-degrading monooxygenase HmoA
MIYEVRVQTVDPEKRTEYVKAYKEAIQSSKEAGCYGGFIMCSDEDPAKVLVLLHWETREHHERWRGTPPHVKFRQTIDPWQTEPSLGDYYVAETI